eukprot:2113086-Rhodomonas_salina.3
MQQSQVQPEPQARKREQRWVDACFPKSRKEESPARGCQREFTDEEMPSSEHSSTAQLEAQEENESVDTCCRAVECLLENGLVEESPPPRCLVRGQRPPRGAGRAIDPERDE